MDSRNLAPGVAEALSAAGVASTPAAPPAPRFIGAALRSTTIPLEWPLEYDGVEYREVVLRRLTTDEVAKFMEAIAGQAAETKMTWPIFRTVDDREIPEIVLSTLDDDDMTALNRAASDFLPRRFRAAPDDDLSPLTGGTTAP